MASFFMDYGILKNKKMKTGKLGIYISICFVLIIVTLLLVGCQASNTAKGTAIGAGTGAVIGGINHHAAVVSPATSIGRRPFGSEDRGHALHGVDRIGGEPPGESERRVQSGCVRFAEAQRHVAVLVHGDASHPQSILAGGNRSLLKNLGSAGIVRPNIPIKKFSITSWARRYAPW